MSLLQRQINANKRDLDFLIQNDRIGIEARAGQLNQDPLQMQRPYDDEQVREFQKKQQQQYHERIVKHTDPITGVETEEKVYGRYNNSAREPTLEPEPVDATGTTLVYVDENMLHEEIARTDYNQFGQNIMVIEEAISEANKQKKDMENKLGNPDTYHGMSRNQAVIARANLNNLIRQKNTLLTKLGADLRQNQNRFENALQRAQQLREEAAENNAKIEAVRKINREKVDNYRDELNFLNRGAFSTEKAPYETEEQYLDRLKANAEITQPAEELFDARADTARRFREKMRELIRDQVVIEQVVHSIDDTARGDTENRYKILKYFPLIKKKFEEIYGTYPHLTAAEVLSFLQPFLRYNDEESAVDALSLAAKSKKENSSFTLLSTVDYATILKNGTPIIYLIPGEVLKPRTKATFKHILLLSYTTPDRGEFMEWKTEKPKIGQTTDKYLDIHFDLTERDLAKLFGGHTKPEEIAEYLNGDLKVKYQNDSTIVKKDYENSQGKPTIIHGWGIRPEHIPKAVPFGKVEIHPHKLFYENTLVVKHPKGGRSIANFPNVKVSEKFVKILLNLLVDKIRPSLEDLHRLPTAERQLFDRLIHVGNLHKTHPHNAESSISALKRRLKMCESEIEIGNNSPAIYAEIKRILATLYDFKILNRKEMLDYLQQFEKYNIRK